MRFDFVIPARNESLHIGQLISSIRSQLAYSARIIVVDNASTDTTSSIARDAGADEVVYESRVGKGYAVIAGAKVASAKRLFVCDADICGMDWTIATQMIDSDSSSDAALVRARLDRPPEASPVTTLLAVPILRALGHKSISEPLGGVFSIERSVLVDSHLPGDWGFDIGLSLHCLNNEIPVIEIPVSGVTHRSRPISEYSTMAGEVASAIVHFGGFVKWRHAGCTLCC